MHIYLNLAPVCGRSGDCITPLGGNSFFNQLTLYVCERASTSARLKRGNMFNNPHALFLFAAYAARKLD
jgi:hypothetical protein